MALPQAITGVDIARGRIDIFTLATRAHARMPATKQVLARFSRGAEGCLAVCGAAGGHERPVTKSLAQAGAAFARADPRQARAFARATGPLARAARVDADRARLAGLAARRDDLVAGIGRERVRAGATADPWTAGEIMRLPGVLPGHLAAVEGQIAARIAACPARAGDQRRRTGVPGIGAGISRC